MQGDRDQLVHGLEQKIAALDTKTGSLEKSIKKLFSLLGALKEQLYELKFKEEVRSMSQN